jgi:hypothetical protein
MGGLPLNEGSGSVGTTLPGLRWPEGGPGGAEQTEQGSIDARTIFGDKIFTNTETGRFIPVLNVRIEDSSGCMRRAFEEDTGEDGTNLDLESKVQGFEGVPVRR